jgi:hypothetical protein
LLAVIASKPELSSSSAADVAIVLRVVDDEHQRPPR